ncbi:MAG: hypothetical protein ACE5DW_03810 [Thermodesulfobacteriota bacterium]
MRDKILTIFFILLITSQVYGMAFTPKVTLNEKRLLAKIPEFRAERLLMSSYYADLGKFLNDRYPYRAPLILAKNWIDYYVFSTSPSPKVHIGAEGWLYIRSGIKSYLQDECNKKKKALNLARTLNSIEKFLISKDKEFLFIVAPDKATIYPEHIGFKRPENDCGTNFYELFLRALKKYPLKGFIRLDDRLLKLKEDFPVYYRSGTHWNDRGSIIAGNAILKGLSTPSNKYQLPEIRFKEIEDLRDLTILWGLNLTETVDAIRIWKKSDREIKIKKLKPLKNGRPRLLITTTAAEGNALLPETIIYRDSFMSMPLKLTQGYFKKINAIWTHKIPVAPKVDYPTLRASKIIIIEVVERKLYRLKIREKALREALDSGAESKNKANN